MYKSLLFILLATGIIYLSSCRKKEVLITKAEEIKSSDYLPLKEGNYWIYKQFERDTNGVVTSLNITDSVYVVGESLINGRICIVVCNPDRYAIYADTMSFYRFDNEKLLDGLSQVIMSVTDFQSVLQQKTFISGPDTLASMTLRMADKDAIISVKAGTFSTINARTTWKQYKNPCINRTLFPDDDILYALNVGIVYQKMSTSCYSNKIRYRELVRYHVN